MTGSITPSLGRGTTVSLDRRDIRPLWVIHGGPQADPLRRLLNSVFDSPYVAVSTASADDMGPADLPGLLRLLNHADAFVCERLPAGYRDLPIGLDDLLAHVRPGIPVVTFPRISYAGLHPFQVGRDPEAGLADPPLVPYHDLRSVAVASESLTEEEARNTFPSPQVLREFAAWQLLRMRREEERTDCAVAHSVRGAGLEAVSAVDRPGNDLLIGIARDVQRALGVDVTAIDPGSVLLGRFRCPVDPRVARALGAGMPKTNLWSAAGQELTLRQVHEAQIEWYREHPDVLKAVIAAEAARMDLLGLL